MRPQTHVSSFTIKPKLFICIQNNCRVFVFYRTFVLCKVYSASVKFCILCSINSYFTFIYRYLEENPCYMAHGKPGLYSASNLHSYNTCISSELAQSANSNRNSIIKSQVLGESSMCNINNTKIPPITITSSIDHQTILHDSGNNQMDGVPSLSIIGNREKSNVDDILSSINSSKSSNLAGKTGNRLEDSLTAGGDMETYFNSSKTNTEVTLMNVPATEKSQANMSYTDPTLASAYKKLNASHASGSLASHLANQSDKSDSSCNRKLFQIPQTQAERPVLEEENGAAIYSTSQNKPVLIEPAINSKYPANSVINQPARTNILNTASTNPILASLHTTSHSALQSSLNSMPCSSHAAAIQSTTTTSNSNPHSAQPSCKSSISIDTKNQLASQTDFRGAIQQQPSTSAPKGPQTHVQPTPQQTASETSHSSITDMEPIFVNGKPYLKWSLIGKGGSSKVYEVSCVPMFPFTDSIS